MIALLRGLMARMASAWRRLTGAEARDRAARVDRRLRDLGGRGG